MECGSGTKPTALSSNLSRRSRTGRRRSLLGMVVVALAREESRSAGSSFTLESNHVAYIDVMDDDVKDSEAVEREQRLENS
jgi:hypothetical protein